MELLLLAFAAGLVHVVAPDHWVPASILTWRRGWGRGMAIAFSCAVSLVHVALGALLFWAGSSFFERVPPGQFFGFSVLLIAGVAVIRGLRFSRVREVVRTGGEGSWGILAVISLMGPAESLIPVLLKAHHRALPLQEPLAVYLLGTFVMSASLVVLGQRIWNRPQWLTRGMGLVRRRLASVPIAASVAVSVLILLR